MDSFLTHIMYNSPILGLIVLILFALLKKMEHLEIKFASLETKVDFILGKYDSGVRKHAPTP